MNSSVGWNSLSRAGKLSPEGDFSKFEKSAGGRFAAEGREMLSDSESTKYTTLRGGGGILNPDSNKFARVGGKHSTAVGVSKLLDSILHLRYQEQVCCCWQLVSS